ncbi:MAG: oligoendopeptidase F [Flavobacteriales bacterium]|jgi:oligoendopeptidase F
MSKSLIIPTAPERTFVPKEINLDDWNAIEPLLENLISRKFNSKDDLYKWLLDRSELDAVIEENVGRRYIKMTIDTRVEEAAKSYEYFITEINPKISPYEDQLNRKLNDSPYKAELTSEGFDIYLRSVSSAIELYREENNELFAQDATLGQKYGAISGKQSITYKGEEMTMQQAGALLKSTDRSVRKEIFDLTSQRRLEDQKEMDDILTEMIVVRTKIAKNAGFENYRDYKFKSMGRFDYSVKDCLNFHESIEKNIVPILKGFNQERKEALKLEHLMPYDTSVSLDGKAPLKPFENAEELIDKSISLFYKIDGYCGDRLAIMKEMKHLDLASKAGKSPGGYNYPLYEIGVPFIFMNSVGLQRDLITMIHEGGHAVHSFLSRDLPLTPFKSLTSEIAELASMSMELMSMEHWEDIYQGEDLIKAKKEQLQGVLEVLPWIAIVDSFQHWLYENPDHSIAERHSEWNKINQRFSTGIVNWEGYEDYHKVTWQRQLHIFEVPFYYIEYGMAQLGAIAMWRNYVKNPSKTMEEYKAALALGYTKSIPDVYATGGVQFDFSADYVSELSDFVMGKLEELSS